MVASYTQTRIGADGKEMSPIDCESLIDGVLADLQTSLEESGTRVTRDPMPVVVANRWQLSRLLISLIGNALRHRGEVAPAIHVGYETRNGESLFTVKDNGSRIDPSYAQRVLVVFQRSLNGNEHGEKGIGLAICQRIVERHGGRIWVESEAGQGATFYFTISTSHNGVRFL